MTALIIRIRAVAAGEPDRMSSALDSDGIVDRQDSHLVAYEAAQRGAVRAWRCQRCLGVWLRWADIGGPCVHRPFGEMLVALLAHNEQKHGPPDVDTATVPVC